jgi:hypothetical protein
VKAAKNRVQQIKVVGGLLKIEQLLVQVFQNLTGFNQKILENFVARVYGHSSLPLTA